MKVVSETAIFVTALDASGRIVEPTDPDVGFQLVSAGKLVPEAWHERVLAYQRPASHAVPLGDLTVKELHAIAKANGLSGYSRLQKDDLVAAIEGAHP